MAPSSYRIHRVQPGDEWVVTQLARGNARFGSGDESEWLPPLGGADAAAFVADPDTICVVAVEEGTNQICGFAYGGVLLRRHTRLKHVCLYEIGIDIDHRRGDVGMMLLRGFAEESRALGIDRGFVITSQSNTAEVALYRAFGALTSPDTNLLFGLQF